MLGCISMKRLIPTLGLLLLSVVLAPRLSAASAANEEVPARPEPPLLSRPGLDSVLGPQRARLRRTFDRALAALDSGKSDEAAVWFEELVTKVDWPDASYNAALARYRLLDLPAAERHAAEAARGLPNDVAASHLHALVLHDLGRHRDALQRTAQALELLGEGEDPLLRGTIELTEGAALRLLGRTVEASGRYQSALERGLLAGGPYVVAAAWLGLGHLALARGDDAGASEAFAAAGKVTGEGGRAARTEVALAAAEASWRVGKSEAAKRRLSEAISALDSSELPPLNRAGLAARVAALEWSLGKQSQAETRLRQAELVFKSAGTLAASADVWVTRSSWMVATGRLAGAAQLLDQAIAAQQGLQVPVALASSRLARSQLLANEGDVQGGLVLAKRSLEVFTELGFREGEQGAWLVLAELKGRGGALAEAREAALRAVSIAKELGNPRLAATARAEVAVVLARLGAVDEALTEYELATVRTASSMSLLAARSRVRVEVEIAAALAKALRPEEGLVFAQRAIAAATGEGAPADLLPLGEEAVVAVLLESGRHDDALAFLDARGITEGRLREATLDRAGTELFNEGVDAYQAGSYGLAAARFRQLIEDASSPEERIESARKALQEVLSTQGAEAQEAGRTERAEELWAEACDVAQERGDVEARSTLLLLRAQVAVEAGEVDRAVGLAQRCGTAASDLEDATYAAQCWELAGHAAFESDPVAARRGFENALVAWSSVPDSVAHRAQLAYNLAVLDQQAGPAALRARLDVARTLAVEASDAELTAELAAWIEQLEVPDGP